MIVHISPRRVAVVSGINGVPEENQLDLDCILSLDLFDDQVDRPQLIIDLLSGKQINVGPYSDPAEAGADLGKLRILLGLPAWPKEWEADAASRIQDLQPRGSIRHIITMGHLVTALMACILIGLAGCTLHAVKASSGVAQQTILYQGTDELTQR